jgi:hypothetical protein
MSTPTTNVHAPAQLACDVCGRGPAIRLRIRRSAGIVYMKLYTTGAVNVCKECGLEMIRVCQIRSAATAAINPLTAPYAIGQNLKWASRLKKLADPA